MPLHEQRLSDPCCGARSCDDRGLPSVRDDDDDDVSKETDVFYRFSDTVVVPLAQLEKCDGGDENPLGRDQFCPEKPLQIVQVNLTPTPGNVHNAIRHSTVLSIFV